MKIFEENGIEIFEHNGAGYEPTMNYGAWRVALANTAPHLHEDTYERIERHNETDEVFVLLYGCATLVIGKEQKRYKMENGKIYNVKAGVWHAILIEENAKVLIVENHNTSIENSEYYYFKEKNNE